MLGEHETDVEALYHQKQKIMESTLYQFLFNKDTLVDRKALIEYYAEGNSAQSRLFTAIIEQNSKDLIAVIDEFAHDPEAFNFNDLRTFNFTVMFHLWLSYFPDQSGALAVVERLDMSNIERKLCLDVIRKEIAELDVILEEAAEFSEEGLKLKLFNPFVYAELKRLDRMFSIVRDHGSMDEFSRLLDCPIGGGVSLNAARRMEHVLRWASHFKNSAVPQFLNVKYKLIETARARRDHNLVEYYERCGMQEVPREVFSEVSGWSLLGNVSLATTDFFARSANTATQYVRSFWEQNSPRGPK